MRVNPTQKRIYRLCETPKSPPGDYNLCTGMTSISGILTRVKHLNPRQGITTRRSRTNCFCRDTHRSCETPKSPPGDYNTNSSAFCNCSSVIWCETPKSPPGDYNPQPPGSQSALTVLPCETPKSPPGDYNHRSGASGMWMFTSMVCETPKSPPGDYNLSIARIDVQTTFVSRVKHLNPRQGITTVDCLYVFL